MYNKKIIFGSADAYIINDLEIKKKVIDYLYSKLDLSKHRYIMLNNIQKLKFLQENEHYVSPNFKGYNYLVLFLQINDKPLTVAIDRKKLSYHKSQLDMKTIQIIQLHVKTSESIFRGTIFDGKLIQTAKEYIYLIQDAFYLMGNKMLEMEMGQKIIHLDTILKTHFRKDKNLPNPNYCDNFDFKLNKLSGYSELEGVIENMPALTINTNGLIFYPKFSGVNVIHIEKKMEKLGITSNSESVEQKSYHIIHDFVNFLNSRNYSYETGTKTKIYWLSRTTIPDVYDISEKENGDKFGIALIPNLKTSHMCDNIIQDKPIKFNCIYSNKHKKWIPLNVAY
jgi:hypothetical protein